MFNRNKYAPQNQISAMMSSTKIFFNQVGPPFSFFIGQKEKCLLFWFSRADDAVATSPLTPENADSSDRAHLFFYGHVARNAETLSSRPDDEYPFPAPVPIELYFPLALHNNDSTITDRTSNNGYTTTKYSRREQRYDGATCWAETEPCCKLRSR
jgi:hypothetical protein